MDPPRKPKRTYHAQRIVAPTARWVAEGLRHRAAGQRGRVAHRLVPKGAPETAQAAGRDGGEGAEEHGVRVRGIGVWEQEQRRGKQGAPKSNDGVDVRADSEGSEREVKKIRQGRGWKGGEDGEGAVGEVGIVAGGEGGGVEEEEGGDGDEKRFAEVGGAS